ncbi:dickkopf-related protein 2-like [Pseudoliparis swirei]|uniref:dickkopf-related protein 2-like n=1 Tax=Pseudoliparis swirei TaxID=2059687 RepID=UPI0024BD60DA|nr:dickkopf-related protein 2-like [Pseudoliparis swirei]
MCCPSNRCSNDVCMADAAVTSQMIPDHDGGRTAPSRGWRKRGRAEVKGQLGAPCVRSPDCSPGLCCARHFWTRICKPVLQGGQVCTRHRRRKGTPGLELFQRCPCGDGLRCRTPRRPGPRSSSTSSSMAAAAAKSKFTAPSSHRAAPLSLSAKSSSSSSSKARLHVCQEN